MSTLFDENDFIFTNASWMTLAVNGSLSAASSVLIMSIIFRSSPESRTSAYHIIMFFMSFWDTVASIAMALNTTVMPSDVYETYPFAGKAYGTIGTCEAQGFLILMGSLLVLSSNIILNVYYVCSLRYGMAQDIFKRRILPVCLVIAMFISIFMPIVALRIEYFNPSPLNYYCTYNAYPYGCNLNQNEESGAGSGTECMRGQIFQSTFATYRRIGFILLGGAFVVLILSLMLVVATVFQAELTIRKARNTRLRRNHTAFREIEFRRTRSVLIQALMYIVAFILTYVWTIIFFTRVETYSVQRPSYIMAFLNVFFPPLQGFFNALIFTYQKAHTLRLADSDLDFFDAFKQVIRSPSTVPDIVVSKIEIADEEIRLRRGEVYRTIPVNSRIRRRGQVRTGMVESNETNYVSPGQGSTQFDPRTPFDISAGGSQNFSSMSLDEEEFERPRAENPDEVITSSASKEGATSSIASHSPLPNESAIPCSAFSSVRSMGQDGSID